MATTTAKPNTLEARWEARHTARTAALNRKRDHAELTLPFLLPLAGKSQHQDLPVPYNTLPAEGINALAARIVSTIVPLGGLPLFEFFLDTELVPEGEDTVPEQEVLTRVEKAVTNRLYLSNLRPQLFLAIKHLIVIGDVLMFQKKNLDLRLYRFDEYTVARTTEGEWREIIIREMIDPELNKTLDAIKQGSPGSPSGIKGFPRSNADRGFEPLFTRLTRDEDDGPIAVEREFRGTALTDAGIDDQETMFKVAAHFPLRWGAVSGEDYGVSLIEESFGDVRSLDGLSAALIDGAALNSEYRWGVNPGGITEIDDLRQSVNGDWVPAGQKDVYPLAFQNSAQISHTLAAVTHREERLGRRFLMNSVVQPRGERVTARQVTIIAQELEQALGGALSMINRDILIPLIIRSTTVLSEDESNVLPPAFGDIIKDKGIVKLRVRAGLELLQREAEQERLDAWLERMANLPDAASEPIKWAGVQRRIMKNMGVESTGIVKTDEEIEAERQQAIAQQNALMAQQTAQQAAVASVRSGTGEPTT